MDTINLNEMTADQRAELKKQLDAQERAEKERVKAEREEYKTMVDETVRESFPQLVELSRNIKDVKNLIFNNFETVVVMKGEIFGIKESQQSHSFTTAEGDITIKIGHRVNENFDDTLGVGIEKVKTYMATLAKDTESAALVETIMDLLKKDAKGNLKASRVLELRKLANRVQNAEFSDGIRIIEESYKPVKSCQFIEVKFKDEHGREHALPLSISAFDIE